MKNNLSLTRRITQAGRWTAGIFFFLSFFIPLSSYAVGINYIQKLLLSPEKAINWCGVSASISQEGVLESAIDANGYYYASTTYSSNTDDVILHFDHSEDCTNQNANFGIPIPFNGLTSADGYTFYTVTGFQPDSGDNSVAWLDEDGNSEWVHDTGITTESYSLNGQTYYLNKHLDVGYPNPNSETGSGIQANIEWFEISETEATDHRQLYGVWYTATDLLSQINNLTDFLVFFEGEIDANETSQLTDVQTRIVDFTPSGIAVNTAEGDIDEETGLGNVPFQATYYYNSASTTEYGSYDQVCIEWWNVDLGSLQNFVPNCTTIDSSGQDSFSGTKALTEGLIEADVYFYNSATGVKEWVRVFYFSNGISSQSIPTPENAPQFGTSTPTGGGSVFQADCDAIVVEDWTDVAGGLQKGLCAFSNFIGNTIAFFFKPNQNTVNQFTSLPNQINSKFPFSYYTQIKTLVASSSFATSTIGSFTFNSGSTTPLNYSVTLFSMDKVQDFIPSGTASAIKTLLTAILWLGFMWTMYTNIQGLAKRE